MPRHGLANIDSIYRLRIELRYIYPLIWREVLVPGWFSLHELHAVIQLSMDWDNSHLHDFEIAGQRYGEVEAASNEDEFAVAQLARKRSKFRYTYDFGDTWIHDISVKEIVPPEPGIQYPWCVGGARCAPPEDSGGPYAYERYLSDLDPEEEFDPEAFSVDAVNRNLHPEPKKRKPRKRNT